MIRLRAGSATDVGRVRTNNQDQLLLADPLYAVADGMGGHAAGEVASAVAVRALEESFAPANTGDETANLTAERLVQAAQAANLAVWEEAEANPEMHGMGTTLVAIALVDGPQLAVINIGDSRLYALHDGDLRQVTFDHNLVAELLAEGRISPEEAEVHPRRNIMTRALGVEPKVVVDLFVEEPVGGDRYLLCSDGLPREVSDDLIASILRRLSDPNEAATELVEEAKRRGGNDNITVVVVDIASEAGDAEGEGLSPPAGASGTAVPDATTVIASSEALPAVTAANLGDTTVVPAVGLDEEKSGGSAGEPKAPPAKQPRSKKNRRPQVRAINLRVAAFVVGVLVVLAAGAAGVVWYARNGYFVGLAGKQIVIFQGRPGGVLWFEPTVAEVTPHTTADVLAVAVPELEVGQQEPSISAARTYVANLITLSAQARQAQSSPSTIVAPTTTVTTAPTAATSTTVPTGVSTKASA